MKQEKEPFKKRLAFEGAVLGWVGAFLVLFFDEGMHNYSKVIIGILLFCLMYMMSLEGQKVKGRSF